MFFCFMFFCCVHPFVEVVVNLGDPEGVFMQWKEVICSGGPERYAGVTVCFPGLRVQCY